MLLNVRRTIREFIFPTIKFINDEALCMVKLVEENNILHILLRELNRLDDNEEKRARFWLRYRGRVALPSRSAVPRRFFLRACCESHVGTV